MKNIFFLFIGLAGLAGLAGCSRDRAIDLPVEGVAPSNAPIGFHLAQEVTRAEEVTPANLEGIGVYGYHTGVERWGYASAHLTSTLKPDYFCNTELKKADGWVYSPLRYWPLDPIYRLSFFAYSPYVGTTGGSLEPWPATASQTGVPTLRYTVPAQIGDQIDLLWAAKTDMNIEQAKAETKVAFDLQHALVRIAFSAQFADATEAKTGYSVRLKGITIDHVHGTGSLDLGTGAWTLPTGAGADTFVMEDDDLSGAALLTNQEGNVSYTNWLAADSDGDPAYLMMIPQDITDAVVVYDLEFDNGEGVKTDVPMAFELSDYEPWAAGRAIEYKLLARAGFIILDTDYTVWENKDATGTIDL